ncbi:MAG: NAD(P)H-binding protein [Candidatus Paceibacterota bacterium]
MKIILFGADGRTGSEVLRLALARGFDVRAFVRSMPPVPHKEVEYCVGDVLVPETVKPAVAGVDAVVSVIGHISGSDPRLQTKGITNIITAMQAAGVERLISMTGAGVTDPDDVPQGGGVILTKLINLIDKDRIADGREHAEVIRRSGTNWTIVRCPKLTNRPRTGEYQTGYIKAGLFNTIARADVADFILRCLENREYIHAAPIIVSE